jgi:alkanesulfonate monooxygenase SsuD/methylene tetrahydromethanopterin reductase-like flavin-dependent oxidoreductase (luciferase family)
MQFVKIGVFDHFDRGLVPLSEHYENRLKLIEAYDRVGLDAYHVAEHHATPLGLVPSPNLFLSAIAQRTRRLRFGALVHPLPLYHPLRLAEEICMLDHLSGGRLEFGIGRGASPHEIAYYGVDPDEAQARYFESSAVVLKALQGGNLDHEGKFFRFQNVPIEMTPVQRPHPPLWYGAWNANGVEWAARNKVNIVINLPAEGARWITDGYRAAWRAAGHESLGPSPLPLLGINRFVVVADSDAEALAIARRAYAVWHRSFYHLFDLHGTKPANATYPATYDEAQAQGYAIAAEPETVRDTLIAQLQSAGSNYCVCRFAFGDITLAESLRSLDLFAKTAIPAIAAMFDVS